MTMPADQTTNTHNRFPRGFLLDTLHAACLVFALLTSATVFAQGTQLLAPSESVNGVSQAVLSQRWWQWAMSFDEGKGPINDLDGKDCAANQPADVWFLAGTYEGEPVSRTCKIPAGRPIFFPLVNYIYFPYGQNNVSCASMKRQVAALSDDVKNLSLELNGKALRVSKAYRQVTPNCFDAGANKRPPTKISPSAANGYYVALAPLPKGTHKLRFSGELPDNVQKIEYTLIVE
jgi:hypothetical protein